MNILSKILPGWIVKHADNDEILVVAPNSNGSYIANKGSLPNRILHQLASALIESKHTAADKLGPLPDPVTKGWLATVADLKHMIRSSTIEHRDHQLAKLDEIHQFLLHVEKARDPSRAPTFVSQSTPEQEIREICEEAEIEFDMDRNLWTWKAHTESSTLAKPSIEDASLHAVHTLFPRRDWAYEVENGDTDRSYHEWALDKATHYAEDNRPANQTTNRPAQ